MDTVAKAVAAQGDLADVADLLYGDGAWEYVEKSGGMAPEVADRKKRAATAGLSAVGATAGAAGLGLAAKETRTGYKAATGATKLKKLSQTWKSKKLATTLIPLEVAGLGGELLATKILHGDTKKVHKAQPPITPAKGAAVPPAGMKAKSSGFLYSGGRPLKKLGAAAGPTTGEVVKNFDIEWGGEISKVDADKRQVFGWASVITMDGKPVVDLQNDYMELDTIEKAAYDYVKESRKGGNMHARDGESPKHVSDLIESFVVTDEKKKTLGLPDEFPTGWLVGFQVNDDETWQQVKDGKRKEFSIHGSGQRVEKMLDE